MHYKLYTVPDMPEGDTLWCGPTVLCLLSGKTPTQVRRAINKIRKRKYNHHIKSTDMGELGQLLKRWKFQYDRFRAYEHRRSLMKFADDMEFVPYPILIHVRSHFLILFEGKVYDSLTPDGCPVKEHRDARKWVNHWYDIHKRWKP